MQEKWIQKIAKWAAEKEPVPPTASVPGRRISNAASAKRATWMLWAFLIVAALYLVLPFLLMVTVGEGAHSRLGKLPEIRQLERIP